MQPFLVIDNSVVMSWCFEDETNTYADAVLDHLSGSKAIVPPVWPLEVVNVLLVAERRRRLTPTDSMRFLELLSKLPISVEHDDSDMINRDLLDLGRSHGLSSYDASYLYLAIRSRCPIATLDQRIMEAAGKAKVPLFSVV
jgi:predicted nucleic acid-binding protein